MRTDDGARGVTAPPATIRVQSVWIQAGVAASVPAGYGEMLRTLTEAIATGKGSRPNDNVEKIKGAPSTKFADFARRSAQAWS